MTATAISSLGEETEVTEKARRRAFTVEYKRKIVKEADACKAPGEIGALLRREGLYSSHLTTWRAGAGPGRAGAGSSDEEARAEGDGPSIHVTRASPSSSAQIAKLTTRAERAEAIAEIQKKLAALFGRPFPSEES